ncbi:MULTISPECIES: DUF1707 SHOCT-like domain-containing protein [Catenuloplanes]|uniref:DUF1707 domain-containing protein n=1 Tax=Catenuloplanes niger TaxID=587534 RepID=A0AAE3ZWX3_9ACTN|nr:DUF1707 domain-containing protein [Catenuloplanes niger]MDR7325613.1 hypothetical protein [Catenuloplanes niger]
MTDPRLRASDADRQRVVADLERHTAAGRLSLDEFTTRVDAVLAARTHGDLGHLTSDLPAEAEPSADARHLLIAFALATVVVALLAVIISVYR